jgi:hypothetical protein
MAVKAKALLGLSITILILSVVGLVINIFAVSTLGIAVSAAQIAVCALGIAGAVTLNNVVLIIGTICKFRIPISLLSNE